MMQVQIRHAAATDAPAVAGLASELAQSFAFSRAPFDISYAAVLRSDDSCLLLAFDGDDAVGYVLGGAHPTFYANGPVASVHEILVRDLHRGLGIGRALMDAFERWAREHGCPVATLATRRATGFYLALGYEESATYLRKLLLRDSEYRESPGGR
jgi:GNAT superfamily N-acetyltransferase